MISELAKSFLMENKSEKSEFEKYKEDIFFLKENNMSITNIYNYLKENFEIKSSYQNLSQWIKRQKKSPTRVDNYSQNKDEISEFQITKEVKKAPETIFVLPDVPKKSSGEMKKYDTSKIERSGSADLLRACTKK